MIIKNLEIPFFPFIDGTFINFPDMLYGYVREESNQVYLIAQYGKDIDLENEFELDDKIYDDYARRFVDALKWQELPPWLDDIEFESLFTDSYYTECNGKFTFTDDYENKLLTFIKENKEYIEKRIRIDNPYSEELYNVDLWLKDKESENYWKTIQELNKYWYEVQFGYKDNPQGNYEYMVREFSADAFEDFYLDNYIQYVRNERIDDDERKELTEKNQKIIDDNYSDYKIYIDRQ